MFVGENVKEFFRRVAAITFEQAILRELESQGPRMGAPQIGSGGVLRKYVCYTGTTCIRFFLFVMSTKELNWQIRKYILYRWRDCRCGDKVLVNEQRLQGAGMGRTMSREMFVRVSKIPSTTKIQ